MNATLEKFGWPQTTVAEFDHWLVLLRPAQPTLGSLVLAAKSEATAFSDLPAAAFAELGEVTAEIERALTEAIRYQKINYLMLMMVDPHVHYHVIPRYEGTREWDGHVFADAGWPKLPELGNAVELSADERERLVQWVAGAFP